MPENARNRPSKMQNILQGAFCTRAIRQSGVQDFFTCHQRMVLARRLLFTNNDFTSKNVPFTNSWRITGSVSR